jgi:hypothetical protein
MDGTTGFGETRSTEGQRSAAHRLSWHCAASSRRGLMSRHRSGCTPRTGFAGSLGGRADRGHGREASERTRAPGALSRRAMVFARIVGECVVGRSWRLGADLTNGPRRHLDAAAPAPARGRWAELAWQPGQGRCACGGAWAG